MGIQNETPKSLIDAIKQVKSDLSGLENQSKRWDQTTNIIGSRKVRSIAQRIVLLAKRVEVLVKENSFSR